ncbi:hypothetical protein JI739_02025 [Ramlibacter sp. AW1]|uniref:Uncharacterized protein n=1 Tax=Ramlibacter aurantiacus TaxID=2801330 RepID=A0A936ZQF2_9BURK|nr:hypothetical protein [Ramlibacter aurantiacus]MBL0419115.1 hypothetical protein [Ramlibacter aurantiacus]
MNKPARFPFARILLLPVAAGCFLGAQAAQPGSTTSGNASGAASGGTVIRTTPVPTQSMDKLTQAAQKLRESIQALAQKPPGKDRDTAMDKAQTALLETQQAMLALPPEMRSMGTAATVSYDDSVKKMMKAADALRESVQAMAQRPAGSEREKAIRAANEALLETQSAMVSAYSATTPSAASSGSAATMGAGTSKPAK